MYLQHYEPNSGCKNLEKKYLPCGMNMMKMCREKVTQNKLKSNRPCEGRMKQPNGCQTERK